MPTANLTTDITRSIKGTVNSTAVLTGSIGTPTALNTGEITYNTLKPIVDSELSEVSTNAVMNKVIYAALQALAEKIPSVSIGNVEQVNFDEELSITDSGISPDVILNFKIPKGKDGSVVSIGEDEHWYIDGIDTGYYAGLTPEVSSILSLFNNNKFAHTITIGEHVYDGTEDIVVDIYNGELSNEEIISVLSLIQEELAPMQMKDTVENSMVMQKAVENSMRIEDSAFNSMTMKDTGENTMIMENRVNTMTMENLN